MNTAFEDSLIAWAATRVDELVFDPRKGFYSFEIVLYAFDKGKEEFKENARRKYFHNAQVAGNV